MKRPIILLLLLTIGYSGVSQNQASGFGGFLLTSSPVAGQNTIMTGGHGAALLHGRYYFGGFGFSTGKPRLVQNNQTTYNVDFDQGGFLVGYSLTEDKRIGLTISSLVGWGDLQTTGTENGEFFSSRDEFFLFTPRVNAHLAITDWCRLSTGIGYQLASGDNTQHYTAADFKGATYDISVVFGWFR
jgi:hypothetical protein